MKILILDPATSTGYCIVLLDKTNNKAEILDYNFLDVDNSSEFQGDWCIDLMDKLKVIIQANDIKEVVVEDYFFGKRFASGTTVNSAYRTAIHILCRQLKLPYFIINPSQWKKYIAGSSTPSKIQKKKWGKEPAKKLFIQQALWEQYNIRFPNHSISKKTNKPIAFRYDIVDAVAQAIFYCKYEYEVKDIYMNVLTSPDVVFNKKLKTMFIYE